LSAGATPIPRIGHTYDEKELLKIGSNIRLLVVYCATKLVAWARRVRAKRYAPGAVGWKRCAASFKGGQRKQQLLR